MRTNDAPVSQIDFAATIVDLVNSRDSVKYGKSVFKVSQIEERNRYFYQYFLDDYDYNRKTWRMVEYLADSKANGPALFRLTDVEYSYDGERIQHSEYWKSCQEGVNRYEKDGGFYYVHKENSDYPQ